MFHSRTLILLYSSIYKGLYYLVIFNLSVYFVFLIHSFIYFIIHRVNIGLIICESSRSLLNSYVIPEVYPLLAQRTFQFLFQPVIDAFRMEFVWTRKSFYDLAGLQIVQADCTRVFVVGFDWFGVWDQIIANFVRLCRLFFLLIFKRRNGIYYVFYFFRRLQWLSVFINLWIFFSILIAVVVLILAMMLLTVVLVVLLLTRIACWVLEVLLLWTTSLISRVVVAIEVYLYARTLSLYVVQHILDIIHYSCEIQELIRLSWLTLWTHIMRNLLAWLPVVCSMLMMVMLMLLLLLLLLLHARYVCHSRNTIHELHDVRIIGIYATHVWVWILLVVAIIVWHSLIPVSLLIAHVLCSRLLVWTSLILLLHIVHLTPWILTNIPSRIVLLVHSMTRMSLLGVELLIHHFKLSV